MQAKLCATQQRLEEVPEPGLNRQESSASHNQCKQSSVLHNNGWGKSRNQVLNRQESSVLHNRDKQSSVSHNWDRGRSVLHNNGWRKCRNPALKRSSVLHNQDKRSSVLHNRDKGKLCVSKQPGKKPDPGFEQAGKLCAAQSGQEELCAAQSGQGEALCLKTARERAGTRF